LSGPPPGLGVGDDRREPVALVLALGTVDLIGAQQRRVDPADDGDASTGYGLWSVHLARRVGVGGDLPAREVDRLEAGADLLDRHVAGQRAERGDVVLAVEQLPQPASAEAGDRVLDRIAAAQPLDVGPAVRARDAVEALVVEGGVVGRRGHGISCVHFRSGIAVERRSGQQKTNRRLVDDVCCCQ
jgi:hypothetical protein